MLPLGVGFSTFFVFTPEKWVEHLSTHFSTTVVFKGVVAKEELCTLVSYDQSLTTRRDPYDRYKWSLNAPPINGLIHRFSLGETTLSLSLLIQLDPGNPPYSFLFLPKRLPNVGFPSVGNLWGLFRWLWARNHNFWGLKKAELFFVVVGNFPDELDLLSTYTVHFSLWIIWGFSVGWLLRCLHPKFQRFSFFDQKGYIWWYFSFGFIGYRPVRWSKNHRKIKTTSAAEKPVIYETEMLRLKLAKTRSRHLQWYYWWERFKLVMLVYQRVSCQRREDNKLLRWYFWLFLVAFPWKLGIRSFARSIG